MGIIHCEKHGKQGFYEVCEHITAEYTQGIYRKHRNFCIGELLGILICEKCWKKVDLNKFQPYLDMSQDEFLDLDDEKTKPIEDKWSEIYDSVGRRAWCAECVAEIIINQTRTSDETSPFSVYEKTLTQLHQEEIDKLEKSLKISLNLKKHQTLTPHYASEGCQSKHIDFQSLSIYGGAFTYPLTISIYSVIDEIEQDKIIESVKITFNEIKLNQVKIEFYGIDNWEEKPFF